MESYSKIISMQSIMWQNIVFSCLFGEIIRCSNAKYLTHSEKKFLSEWHRRLVGVFQAPTHRENVVKLLMGVFQDFNRRLVTGKFLNFTKILTNRKLVICAIDDACQ